jgi:hypothetical protein
MQRQQKGEVWLRQSIYVQVSSMEYIYTFYKQAMSIDVGFGFDSQKSICEWMESAYQDDYRTNKTAINSDRGQTLFSGHFRCLGWVGR